MENSTSTNAGVEPIPPTDVRGCILPNVNVGATQTQANPAACSQTETAAQLDKEQGICTLII